MSAADQPRPLSARDPRTGEQDYPFTAPSLAEIDAICDRARGAQTGWAAAGFAGRIATLRAFAAELTARRADILAALERDTGRRRTSALEFDSVPGAIAGWSAIAPTLLAEGWTEGRGMPSIRHAPQWVAFPLVGAVTPWNFPLLLGLIDAIPALVAGCAVVVKPSEVTPRFAAPVREAIASTPGLADILILLDGDGATGQALIDRVDCVCFTGSIPTGRKVALQAASRLIPAFLELGGKDPLIILPGADLDIAADLALRSSVLSTGQACQSIERIYIPRADHDAFVALLTEKAQAVRLTWPDIGSGDIGPLIFARQADILAAQIADAKAKGARVLTGGEIETHGGGLWLRPTVIVDVTDDMLLMREETFGPVLPVIAYDDVEAAIRLANAGDYGLSAAVFGPTLDAAEAVGRRLDAGAISLNDAALTALFYEAAHQSFKASGLGPSRMGAEGLQRFFRRKALIANTGMPAPMAAFREDG
jgi:acyl-CoA reductase-like NAD-dependent aldehyde dehydrogenase